MTAGPEWWRALYDDLLAEVLLVRGGNDGGDNDEVAQTIAFLIAALELVPGARVFDQCCGIGSLSLPLARAGFDVVGVDLGRGYAERGMRDAEAAGLRLELHEGDAFTFVPDRPCHGVINWWTSFGYADSDDGNRRMLARAFEALVPGGVFALDTMNVPGVLARFRPRVEIARDTALGYVRLVRDSVYDAATGVMHKVWTYTLADGREVRHESRVRAYTPPELARLLGEAGFCEVRFVGSVDGDAFSIDSPRCIAIARRPL